MLLLSRGSTRTTSLPAQGKGKVCIDPTFVRPHLWNYIVYIVVVVLVCTINGVLGFVLFLMKLFQILAGLLSPDDGFLHVERPRSFVYQNPDHQVCLLEAIFNFSF